MRAEPLEWEAFAVATGAGRGVLAVAPHPDDEVLGCGGLLALASRAGAPVRVAFVTDGEASHPGSAEWPPARLATLRRAEARRALHGLRVSAAPVFLGLPDAGTSEVPEEETRRAADVLGRLIRRTRPGLVVSTWPGEPHCDHEFAGLLAQRVAVEAGVPLLSYEVWGPLTGEPTRRPAASGARALPLALGPARAAKRQALLAHASQLGRVVRDDPDGFALSPRDAEAMTGPVETYWATA